MTDAPRLERLKQWAMAVRTDALALWLAIGDPRVPPIAKILAALVAGYALSPIDLIPDFIPVLGYLDDLVLVPLGIMLVIRLIPDPIIDDLRARAARQFAGNGPKARAAAYVIVALWIMLAGALFWHFFAVSPMDRNPV